MTERPPAVGKEISMPAKKKKAKKKAAKKKKKT